MDDVTAVTGYSRVQIKMLHVFDTRLVVDIMHHAGLEVVAVEPLKPYHIIVVARKPLAGVAASPLDRDALTQALRKSPFLSDRQGL